MTRFFFLSFLLLLAFLLTSTIAFKEIDNDVAPTAISLKRSGGSITLEDVLLQADFPGKIRPEGVTGDPKLVKNDGLY